MEAQELTKICSRCPEGDNVKPLSAFYKQKARPDGHMSECKACFRKRVDAKTQEPKIPVEAKVCSRCGEKKVADEFYKWSQSHDGLQSECKDCHSGRNQPIYPRDESIIEKPCSQCGVTQTAIEFYDNPYSKTGMDTFCKDCRKTSNATWNKSKPEKRRPIANRSAKKAREDPDKRPGIYARARKWQLGHPEAVKEHGDKDRAKNGQKPSRIATKRRHRHIRRARLKNAPSIDHTLDIDVLYARDKGICSLCYGKVDKRLKWPDPQSASIDHIIPLSKGGPHNYPNTTLAHLKCNMEKYNGNATQQLGLF